MTDVFKHRLGADYFGCLTGIGTTATVAADAQNEAGACIFTMPEDATITHIGFANSAKTGTPADTAYTISVQGVDASGLPDGTILGGGSPASRTYPDATDPAAGFGSGTYHMLALTNSIALQRGTQYALVNQRTGASDASHFLTIRVGATTGGAGCGYPYYATADATPTWTKVTGHPWYWSVRSASKTYLFPGTNFVANQSVGTTTESGFTFTIPTGFGASNTLAVVGVQFVTGTATFAAAGTYTLNLYSNPTSGSTTILQTTGQLDSDIISATTAGRYMEIYFPEDSLTALVPGTKYAIGFSASGAAAWSMRTILVPDAAAKTSAPMGGLTFCTRTLASAYPADNSDGNFTETATTMVHAELILADFTAAVAGGGLRLGGHGGLAA